MFCSLKIAVCAPKITIISKNCRLKITDISKNYGLKIPVRVRAYARARMFARAHDCMTTQERRTRTNGKERNTEKPAYIGIFADNEKKYKKKLKKIW